MLGGKNDNVSPLGTKLYYYANSAKINCIVFAIQHGKPCHVGAHQELGFFCRYRPVKYCVFGHLGLVFIWSCFIFCLLFLLFYVISAPVPAEAAQEFAGKLPTTSR